MASESDPIIRIEYPGGYLGDNGYLPDFIIGTNDENSTKKYAKIYAHRFILATVSKFFKRKFDSNPTLEYFLLPKRFQSIIIKFVIFCIYNQHVQIPKRYLTRFLEAVKYLQMNGFEEIQQTNLKCEKKFSVAIQRMTHQELEKGMGGRCDDKSHQIDNHNSREITKSTENTKIKSVKSTEASVQVEKNRSNEKGESVRQHVPMQNARPKSRVLHILIKEAEAFNGLSTDVNNNNDEIKPARILRRNLKADKKTEKSMTKKEEDIAKSSLNHSIDIHADNKAAKQAENVFDGLSAEDNPKPSTSENEKSELLKKPNFLPPRSRRAQKVKPENVRKQEELLKSVPRNMNETFKVAPGACTISNSNEIVGTEKIDFIEPPNVKLGPKNTDNNYKAKAMKFVDAKPSNNNHTSYEARSKPLSSASKMKNNWKKDYHKQSQRLPITKANNKASNSPMPNTENIPKGSENPLSKQIFEAESGLPHRGGIKPMLTKPEKQRNVALKGRENSPSHASLRTANKAISERSTTNIIREAVKPLENNDSQKTVNNLMEFKSQSTESNYGEIFIETSVEKTIDSNATSEEAVALPRTAEKRPGYVQVVSSTPRSEATHYSVTKTPMRKIPKIGRSIFRERSRSQNGRKTPDSPKRPKSRLFYLSESEDADSESSFVKAFKSGIWKSTSQTSISSIE